MIHRALAAALLAGLASTALAGQFSSPAYDQVSGLTTGNSADAAYDGSAVRPAAQTQVAAVPTTGSPAARTSLTTTPPARPALTPVPVPLPAKIIPSTKRGILSGTRDAISGARFGVVLGGPVGAAAGAVAGFAIGFLLFRLLRA